MDHTRSELVLTGATTDLLAAVLEALDIPHPATVGDVETHDRILAERAMHAVIALQGVMQGHPLGIEWTTAYLRERLTEHPPTGYGQWTREGQK